MDQGVCEAFVIVKIGVLGAQISFFQLPSSIAQGTLIAYRILFASQLIIISK